MTVRQLLNSLDSRELSEWYIIEDMDFWKKRLSDQEANEPTPDFMLKNLFGQAINSGDVVWQQDQKRS
jgi:hypothetical protein